MEFFAVVWALISSMFIFVCYIAFALILVFALGGATFLVMFGFYTLGAFIYKTFKRFLKK